MAVRQAHRQTDRQTPRERLTHALSSPTAAAAFRIHLYKYIHTYIYPYSYIRPVPPADPTPRPAATHDFVTASRRSTRVAPSRVESSTTTRRPIAAWTRALLCARPAKERAGTVVIHKGVERAGPLDRSVPRLNRLLTTTLSHPRSLHTGTTQVGDSLKIQQGRHRTSSPLGSLSGSN